jgi:bacillithiol biosynthesis cysteine-adding enzyme BshC
VELIEHIQLNTAGIGGKLTQDYLQSKPELKILYQFSPNLDGLKLAASERAKYPVNRKLLCEVLYKQYNGHTISDRLKTNLDLLLQENTFTVTTGHQLNLFTGPLYFIYKIASIISLTNQLNEEIPGNNFIPIYWMNSEDHDFAEINHFFIKGEKLEWKVALNKFGPVGKMPLNNMGSFIEDIQLKFEDQYKNDSVFRAMLEAYKKSKDLAEAHRTIVNKIFGDYGVVIFNQDSTDLKREFLPFISKEIFEKSSIKNIESTNQYLEDHHYKPQVFAREINFFYTGNNLRERIIEFDNGYGLADHSIKWTQAELEQELHLNPQFFSPNVVTRPIYQEFTLPNIAYIGGPAEIAYWLQYKSNFDAHNTFYPALILRDCFLIIPEKKIRKAKELGLKLGDFFGKLDDLINQYIKDHFKSDMDLNPMQKVLNQQYNQLLEQVNKIDPSMGEMVNAAHKKSLNELEKISSKMNKALKNKNDVQLNIIRNLHSTIFPLGVLQERLNNIFDQTFSTHDFVTDIISHSNPLDARLKVLQD